MNKQRTTEKLIAEVFVILLLFLSIGLMVSQMTSWKQNRECTPSVSDLHQQQEMIDYHRSQGRTVTIIR